MGILNSLKFRWQRIIPNQAPSKRKHLFRTACCGKAVLLPVILCYRVNITERTHSLANSAGKAVRMVGFSQSCHYFSFHEFPTAIAAGSIHALVIHRAEVFPVLNEKTSLGQVTATHWKNKTSTNQLQAKSRLAGWKYIAVQTASSPICFRRSGLCHKQDEFGSLSPLYNRPFSSAQHMTRWMTDILWLQEVVHWHSGLSKSAQ